MSKTDLEAALDRVLSKYQGSKRDMLIPILQEIQEEHGYLSREAVVRVGRHLSLPASKVYGVATFYNQFRFSPIGRYHVQCCRGTACHVKGSASVLDAIEMALGIKAGQTSRDALFSLEVVACMGACGLAPTINVNGEFYAGVTPDSVREILNQYGKAGNDDKTA